jgi:hypothetical protein
LREAGETMKDAYFFSHDSNARNDPKIMALINIYGVEGYGRFWIIVEMLREQDDYRLKFSKLVFHALAAAFQITAEDSESFIKDCIGTFELFQSDGEYFWSNSLTRRMEHLESKRQKRADAGRLGAETRWNHGNVSEGEKQTDGNAIANQCGAISKNSKVKESKVNQIKVKQSTVKKIKYADFVALTSDEYAKLVEQFGENDAKRLIELLDNYKGANGKSYKDDYRAILNWVVKRLAEEKGGRLNGQSDADKWANQPDTL